MTTKYEILYLISAKLSEKEAESIADDIKTTIKNLGGEIIKEDNWGKRKLAYPIKNNQYGYYILNIFNLKPSQLKTLEKKLKLLSEIIRYQILKTVEEKKEIHIRKRLAPSTTIKDEMTPPPTENEEDKEKEKELKEGPKKKKVSLEELDKKIEEILEV